MTGVARREEIGADHAFAASILQCHVAVANLNKIQIPMNGIEAKNPTVLVVEDEDDTRYLIRLALEERGYRVCEAENGDEAIVMARQEQPNVILMDISMPRMNGLTATARIREQDNLRTIPIIALTAHREM
jgi:CheY-like chemotaxis protein